MTDEQMEREMRNETDYKLSLFLSSDGKHTVNVEVIKPESRREAVEKAVEVYDFIIKKYGTKQAQAVKEYGNGQSTMQKYDNDQAKQDACSHTNIKFVQSKTEKNPGKWFKSCIDCGKFLGWQNA